MPRFALIKLKMTDSTVVENKMIEVVIVGGDLKFNDRREYKFGSASMSSKDFNRGNI